MHIRQWGEYQDRKLLQQFLLLFINSIMQQMKIIMILLQNNYSSCTAFCSAVGNVLIEYFEAPAQTYQPHELPYGSAFSVRRPPNHPAKSAKSLWLTISHGRAPQRLSPFHFQGKHAHTSAINYIPQPRSPDIGRSGVS